MAWKKIVKMVGLGALAAGKFSPFAPLINGLEQQLKSQGILKDPEAEAKAKALIMQFEKDLAAADTERLKAINTSMQFESKSEHWMQYSWRPAIGFAVALQCGSLGLAFSYLIFKVASGDPFPPNMLMNLSSVMAAMMGLFGLEAGILGIASWKRGDEKIAKIKNGAKQ
ncbi:hypothetical protein LCGC14_1959450 [marine sediment metagenome]|uniref:Uncharacterized protein n=1 Tax=marine sediment metagenome TaxID=412755 RepID=A0A0F9G3D5_9ZZZZ